MSEVASERLNYLSKKQRAVSSRASRHVIPCSNGVTFNAGQTARVDLAGNQSATYWDSSNSYLKMTVNNDDDAVICIESAYALIDTLEVLCDGQVVSSIRQYGAAVHAFLDSEVGVSWKENVGRCLVGTSYNYDDVIHIAAGASKTFCLPAFPLTPFWNSSKYIPMMGRSTISYRITFASAAKGTIGGALDSEIKFNPVEMVVSYIRLSSEANAMVVANTGGRFELICSDVRTAESNIVIGDSVLNVNCGFSFSSLDRVKFASYSTLNTAGSVSVSNRGANGITDYALSINGEEHPRKRIEVSASNVAEPVAEIMISQRSLADFAHQSDLSPYIETTAATASDYTVLGNRYYVSTPSGAEGSVKGAFEDNRGVFIAAIDTESMKPHADPDALYSGLSTLGSVVQLVGNMTTATVASTILVFAQYSLALTLDLNGSQTWVVSI
jgi:hypothetical protein